MNSVLKAPDESASRADYRVLIASTVDELTPHLDGWWNLYHNAVEQNVYLQPDFVSACIEFGKFDQPPLVAFVYRESSRDSTLAFVASFEVCAATRKMPFRHLVLSTGQHGYLSRPLVATTNGAAAIAAFIEWALERGHPWHAMILTHITDESPVSARLLDEVQTRNIMSLKLPTFRRAVIDKHATYDDFEMAMPKKRRQDIRRARRRVENLGDTEFCRVMNDEPVEDFVARLAEIEHRSWKGGAGTSIASEENGQAFFSQIARSFADNDSLLMTELRKGEQTVAMSMNLVSDRKLYALKIAFDPAFRKAGPGIVIAFDTIREFMSWGPGEVDGGNRTDNWLTRLWPDNQQFSNVVIPTSRAGRVYLRVARALIPSQSETNA